ncbi:MAG: hypothetical protein Q9190_004941 [Brigantiaea leucoxantha]
MPGVSFWSLLQSHPFTVTWWDTDLNGKSYYIYLLIKPQAGFTQKLRRHVGSTGLRTWIDGPYGRPQCYSKYGNVMMFASGVGIAAQCGSWIRKVSRLSLLLGRKLNIVGDQDWVRDWMDELLTEDEGLYILRIRLYVLRQFESSDVSYGHTVPYGEHDRINKLYGKPDLQKIIQTEINEKRGRLLISTATDAKMQDSIRQIVQRYLTRDVQLLNLAFEPHERRWWFSAKLTEVKYQGVA